MMKRYITLGGGKRIPLCVYIAAVKRAKANPTRLFSRSLEDEWPATGAEIMREFMRGVEDRINQAVPYLTRGATK